MVSYIHQFILLISKKLKKIDLSVLERLLITLYESGREKRTNIARNSKMGYDKCVLYLECLEGFEIVKKISEGNHVTYCLSTLGIKFCQNTLNQNFVDAQKTSESVFV